MSATNYLSYPALLLVILCTACDGPTSVNATPRQSKFEAKFGEAATKTGTKNSNNEFDTKFLSPSHFACIKIDIQALKKSNDLREIEWDDIEEQAAAFVGKENSRIELIESIWLAIDSNSLQADRSGAGDQIPFVVVVDYANSFDADAVMTAQTKRSESSLKHKALSKTRVAIGSTDGLDGLNKGGDNESALADLTMKWNSESAAQAALTLAPVRSFLTAIFNMAASIPEAQKYSNLPDALKSVVLELNVDDASDEPTLIRGTIEIDDTELAKNVSAAIKNMMSQDSSAAFPQNQAMLGQEMDDQIMFSPTVPTAMIQLGKEIVDEELLSITNEEGQIELSLRKPKSLPNLISASVNDGKRQMNIQERIDNLQIVADAIKAYEKKYDCLPSSSAISAQQAKELGVPAQFGWRTALLPFMNQNSLYASFDFDKPWDAPENIQASTTAPEVFASIIADEETTFHLIKGDDCVYRTGRSQPKLNDVADRKIWTALVMESQVMSAENWIEPTTIDANEVSLEELGRADEYGILTINAGFKVRVVKRKRELIQQMWTSAGGEKMTKNDFFQLAPTK